MISALVLAQACCAGGNALTPARLPEHERFLAGAQAQARPSTGRYDERGDFVPRPPTATSIDLQLDLYAAWRTPWDRLQLAAIMPFVMGARGAQGASALGGGPGDLNLAVRLDAIRGPYGLALLTGVTLPTGVPIEHAKQAFAADATGEGNVNGNLGVALEHTRGPWLFNVITLVTLHAPRGLPSGSEQLRAPGLLATAALTYVIEGHSIGALASYRVEWDAFIDGAPVKDSSRRLLRLGAFALFSLGSSWRATASVLVDTVGQNEPASATILFGLQRGFQ